MLLLNASNYDIFTGVSRCPNKFNLFQSLHLLISMTSFFAQHIYDLKLKYTGTGLLNKLMDRLITPVYDAFEKKMLVKTKIGLFDIHIPLTHHLPFILKTSPLYSNNLVRIAKLVNEKYSDLKFIDIGANIGDSVALLRSVTDFPILCIEGDDYYYNILEKNIALFKDVQIKKSYIGEFTSEMNVNPVSKNGTAYLHQEGDINKKTLIKNISSILEEHELFSKSKMLKIDTDGYDNKIIRGSFSYLKESKPVIFFEYDPYFLAQQGEDSLSIFKFLHTIGYKKLLIYENRGEFILSADIDNVTLLEDITNFYSGRNGLLYCDICVFHEEDEDLFNTVRLSEIRFFEKIRG